MRISEEISPENGRKQEVKTMIERTITIHLDELAGDTADKEQSTVSMGDLMSWQEAVNEAAKNANREEPLTVNLNGVVISNVWNVKIKLTGHEENEEEREGVGLRLLLENRGGEEIASCKLYAIDGAYIRLKREDGSDILDITAFYDLTGGGVDD